MKKLLNNKVRFSNWIPACAGMTMWVAGMTMLFSLLLFPAPALAANSGIFTVSLWVKPTSTIASQALVGKAEELRVFTDASGYAGCQIKSTTWQTASTGTTALTLNSWNHVACAYDKVKLTVYVNGTQTSQTSLTSQIDDTSNALLLGQDSSASTPYSNLTGTTDDFKFYNYARTQKQVTEDAGGGHPAVLASSLLSSSGLTGGSRSGGPVGYWKFDEGHSTTANNSGSGGSALNGTLTGMASPATSTSGWTQAGKFNRGLNFDGGDDVVTISDNSSLDISSSFTMSLWFKTPASLTNQTNWSGFITKGLGTAINYQLAVGDGEYIRLAYYDSTPTVYYVDTSGFTPTLNTWYHLIGVFNDETNTLSIYINGVRYGHSTTASGTPATNNSAVEIAKQSSYYFQGTIDEVKIYPYALTADEVKLDYNKGSAQVLGALSDKTGTGYESNQNANQQYCIPGDSGTCSAPVAEWSFEEGTGSTVNDTSGNANTGTWNGTLGNQWKPGKIGKAGNFNGSDNYVDVAASNSLAIGNSLTVSAWVNVQDFSDNWGIAGKWGGVDTYRSWQIAARSTQVFSVCLDNGSQYCWNTTNTFNPNTWYHIVLWYNTSGVKIYVNGQDQTLTQVSGSGVPNSIQSLSSRRTLIGGWDNYAGGAEQLYKPFKGKIDQVRIFNYARSAAQVAWDYNRGAPVAHWKFNECQGDTAHDSSGNSNHGTINLSTTGTQTTALGMGTCTVSASTPWYNGRTGKFNYSLNFDGTSDYVSVSTVTNLSGNLPTLTISAWVNSSVNISGGVDYPHIVSNQSNSFVVHGLGPVYGVNAGKVGFYVNNDSTNCQVRSTTTLSSNTWYYVTAVYDGSTTKIYVNGRLENTTTGCNSSAINSFTYLNLGAGYVSPPGGDTFWKGQIDDVRVYNYALTALQVKLLYNQNSGIRYGPSTGAP